MDVVGAFAHGLATCFLISQVAMDLMLYDVCRGMHYAVPRHDTALHVFEEGVSIIGSMSGQDGAQDVEIGFHAFL